MIIDLNLQSNVLLTNDEIELHSLRIWHKQNTNTTFKKTLMKKDKHKRVNVIITHHYRKIKENARSRDQWADDENNSHVSTIFLCLTTAGNLFGLVRQPGSVDRNWKLFQPLGTCWSSGGLPTLRSFTGAIMSYCPIVHVLLERRILLVFVRVFFNALGDCKKCITCLFFFSRTMLLCYSIFVLTILVNCCHVRFQFIRLHYAGF